jgi:hypothetical protein
MYERKLLLHHLWAAPSSTTRRPLLTGFRVVVLLMVFGASGVESFARADPACFAQCQTTLTSCLESANGDPEAEFLCQGTYDSCAEQCMRQ